MCQECHPAFARSLLRYFPTDPCDPECRKQRVLELDGWNLTHAFILRCDNNSNFRVNVKGFFWRNVISCLSKIPLRCPTVSSDEMKHVALLRVLHTSAAATNLTALPLSQEASVELASRDACRRRPPLHHVFTGHHELPGLTNSSHTLPPCLRNTTSA